MATTPAQANAKWLANASASQSKWSGNLNSTTKPIVSAAIAQRGKMQQRFAVATAPGGSWESRLSAVGDQGIKQAALAKAGNYGTGINQGKDKQLAAITKIINYENAGLPAIEQMKAQGADGKAVMNAWFDYMSAGRGSLGAE